MADPNTPEAPPLPDVQLPRDVRDVGAMQVILSVPTIVHESVVGLLADHGLLYAINGGKRTMASEADYLRELSSFCNRVPGAAGMLHDYRDRQLAFRREQGRINDQQRRTMEAMMRDPFDKGGK